MNNMRIVLHACSKFIEKYAINLRGLNVLTEVASGSYFWNPFLAMMAGADNVFLHCRDSRYGKTDDVYKLFEEAALTAGFSNFRICDKLDRHVISKADIVTNSGHLRPLDEGFIELMKPHAVICLMWEPWELREGEIDLGAARSKGILVLGTNEHEPPCYMRPYVVWLALKLIMELRTPALLDRFLIIGEQDTLAVAIEEGLARMQLPVKRISCDISREKLITTLEDKTCILVAEHQYKGEIIGPCGIITPEMLSDEVHSIGVIAGQIDKDTLGKKGLNVFPKKIAPVGFMSYQPSELGPYPVMDLFAAGLKVGQISANARKEGLSLSEAAKVTLRNAPALDLEGDDAWIKN